MAIYHFHVGIISRKTGRSAVGASAYRSASKLKSDYDGVIHNYSDKTNAVNASAYQSGETLKHSKSGKVHDYTRKRGVVHTEIMLPANAPREYADRSTLWNAVEKAEKRKDSQTARDIDMALPIELNRKEQIQLVREYTQKNFVDKGMIADVAIHDVDGKNPHAHIMLTTRNVDKQGFKAKNREWNDRKYLNTWRENWSIACNERLDKDKHISHLSLEKQGIDREPTIYIGVKSWNMEKRGIRTERGDINRAIYARNKKRELKKAKAPRLDKRTDRQMLEKPIKKPKEKIHNQPKENKEIIKENEERPAKRLHKLKEKHFNLEKQVVELQETANQAKREGNISRLKAEEITERADNIYKMRERLDELRAERQSMGIFKSKKDIDRQIEIQERNHKQATSYFERQYKIAPEQAGAEIERLEKINVSKQKTYHETQEKLAPIFEQREITIFEYQKQKMLVEISPNKEKIYERLEELQKESRVYRHLVKDDLLWLKCEKQLDKTLEHERLSGIVIER